MYSSCWCLSHFWSFPLSVPPLITTIFSYNEYFAVFSFIRSVLVSVRDLLRDVECKSHIGIILSSLTNMKKNRINSKTLFRRPPRERPIRRNPLHSLLDLWSHHSNFKNCLCIYWCRVNGSSNEHLIINLFIHWIHNLNNLKRATILKLNRKSTKKHLKNKTNSHLTPSVHLTLVNLLYKQNCDECEQMNIIKKTKSWFNVRTLHENSDELYNANDLAIFVQVKMFRSTLNLHFA